MGRTKNVKVAYEKWKLIAWRFVRVFLASFLAEIALLLPEGLPALNEMYPLLIAPAITAGFVALFKAIREYLAEGNYRSVFHRLPL